jgi:hypothetical protein
VCAAGRSATDIFSVSPSDGASFVWGRSQEESIVGSFPSIGRRMAGIDHRR